MQKSKGFTLVELVIVIVILGILAITAAPKFLNLSSDAKISTVNGVKGALQSANAIIYSKAVLAGVHKKDTGATVAVEGGNVALAYGYVTDTAAEVQKVLDLEGGFTVIQATAGSYTSKPSDVTVVASDVLIYTGDVPTEASACMLVYTKATSTTTKPTYQLVTSGC